MFQKMIYLNVFDFEFSNSNKHEQSNGKCELNSNLFEWQRLWLFHRFFKTSEHEFLQKFKNFFAYSRNQLSFYLNFWVFLRDALCTCF